MAGAGATGEVLMSTAGTIKVAGVTSVETFVLASGAANALTLAPGNFTGIAAGLITVVDGNSNNTVNASTLSAGEAVKIIAGTGADALTGGHGNDTFFAGGKTKMTGGAGINDFTFAH